MERLGLLSRGALVAGALFEGWLTTLTVPLAAITPSTHEGHSPLRRVVVAASAAGYTAVARSWWVEQARELAGLSETEARLLFDQVDSLSLSLCARVCVAVAVAEQHAAPPGCGVGRRCQHAAGEGQRGVSEDEGGRPEGGTRLPLSLSYLSVPVSLCASLSASLRLSPASDSPRRVALT